MITQVHSAFTLCANAAVHNMIASRIYLCGEHKVGSGPREKYTPHALEGTASRAWGGHNFHAFPVLSWALWAQPRTWLIAALLAVDSDPPKLTLN